jgi:hypothetical protein
MTRVRQHRWLAEASRVRGKNEFEPRSYDISQDFPRTAFGAPHPELPN